MIFFDFETRGVVDLIKLGATRYATDDQTQALCACWTYGQEGRIRLWHRGHPWIDKTPEDDPDFLELIERVADGEIFEAHNSYFEFSIWNGPLLREFPEFRVALRLEQMRCSAAKGSCMSLPRALGDAAKAIGLDNQKLVDGRRLINKLSKPMPRRRGQPQIARFCEEEIEHRRNWDYCKQDVRTEREYSNWCPEMTERELEYWRMDFRMNQRGILLDETAAREALELARLETDRLNSELFEITGGRVDRGSRRAVFKKWANETIQVINPGAVGLLDTKADTLSFELYGVPTKAGDEAKDAARPATDAKWEQFGEAGEPLHRALEICLEVNRTSVSKYKQMVESMCPDGRLHDIMLYNGADRTGRWSGKGVQPHNFVRGYSKDMCKAWDDILTLDREYITLIWGEPLPALAKACRGALVASPGKELYAADFNAIEARKLAWLSGCASQLLLFRTGGDPYIDMACGIYKMECDATDKEQIKWFKNNHPDKRALGKRAILGLGYCHAADTLILTKRGWVRIDKADSDMLWDGIEWVSHKGLVCNGEKSVTNLGDSFSTMDHPIWCEDRFHHAGKVVANETLRSRALAAGKEALPLLGISSVLATASNGSWCGANAERRNIKSIWRIGAPVAQRVATSVRNMRQRIEDMRHTKPQCQKVSTENDTLIDYPRQSDDATTHEILNSKITAPEGSRSAWIGTKIEPLFSDIFGRCQVGMIHTLKWIEGIMIAAMSRAIFASRLGVSNVEIRVGRKEKVYDLIDSGPRNRYMILTCDGPMIVHNSMGWEKFQATVWAEEGIWLEDEFCQMVVKVYRKDKCPEVPRLWKDYNAAAIDAVMLGGERYAGGDETGIGAVSYFVSGPFLHCRLPSGRLLAYLYPEVHTRCTWRFNAINERSKPCKVNFQAKIGVSTASARYHAEKLADKQRKRLTQDPPENFLSPHLSFMGRNIITKQWQRCGTHGGTLVENADQASSRDLLAEAMFRVDMEPDFDLLLSIHDEVIAEAPIGTATVKEFEAMMAADVGWAPGMPIAAEGWIGHRLRK